PGSDRSADRTAPALALADTLYRMKEYRQSESLLDTLPRTLNPPDYLRLRALNALHLGSVKNAVSWSELYARMYKNDLNALLVMLEIAWTTGEPERAAMALSGYSPIGRLIWQSEIGAVFLRTLPDSAAMSRAVSSLKQQGMKGASSLGQLAQAAYAAGRADV